MKIRHKISSVILFAFCLLLSFQIAFAQDISALKADIYSKLRDKRCNMPLSECDCPDAREMKVYIDALLELGANKDDIFYRVARKFSLNLILDAKIKTEVEKRLIKEAGGKRPQAILENASFNFGAISKKQGKISRTFKLYNKGNDILILKNIKTSCGCVTAAVKLGKKMSPYFGTSGAPANWQEEINAGKSAEIEALIDLNHRSVVVGKLIREIYVTTNDPLNPELSLILEAEVKD